MKLLKRIFPKPSLFSCLYTLEHMSKLFGISCHNREFGFNYASAIFILVLIWFSSCSVGTGLCWIGCNAKVTSKNMIILMFGIRLIQAGLLFCIIKFRFSTEQVKRILHLSNRLDEKNADFISFRYHRRNFVISTLFLAWILCKAVQLKDLKDREKHRTLSTHCNLYKYACTYLSTWPLSILCWQFLVWMQVFSSSLKISIDELRCAVLKSQETPCTKYELQIFECVAQVRAVLKFKEKILQVYGPSVLFCQLRAALWVILNAHWNSYKKNRYRLIFLMTMFTFNIIFSFLPHWVGQEVTSEGSEMLSDVLRLQVTREPLIFSKRLSNFLFGLMHQNLKFRVFNLFDLTHRQFLTFLSISIGFLIIQLQMIL